jgi:hypothetical protein
MNLNKVKRRRRKRRSPFKIDPLREEWILLKARPFYSSRDARVRSNRLRNVIGLCMHIP